jgi:CheY-like chemotaxis protein
MDGWEFMEHQSRDPELTDIPVIVLSATVSGQPAGASAVLRKPVQIDAVMELIQQFIPNSQNSA